MHMSAEEPTVGDMSITDEHGVLNSKATFKDVAAQLSQFPNGAILVEDAKSGGIVGVVTIRELLSVCAQDKAPAKVKISARMKQNIVEMPSDMPLSNLLDQLSTASPPPDAIVIRNSEGQFVGYFSPDDYRDAVNRLEAHKAMLTHLERSKNSLEGARGGEDEPEKEEDDLLSTLLGDFEEEEEDDLGDTMSL